MAFEPQDIERMIMQAHYKEAVTQVSDTYVDRANSLFEKNKNLGQYIELFNELTSKNYEEKNKD